MKNRSSPPAGLAPLIRAGLIAGVVVAAARLPAGRGRPASAPRPGGRSAEHAGGAHRRRRPRRPPTSTPTTARPCSPCSTRSTASPTKLADMSPYISQAIVAVRGHPVLRAQRRRRQGHGPGLRGQPAGRRRLPGRLDADHAVRPDGAARRRRDAAGGDRGHRADQPPASCAEMRLAHRAGEAQCRKQEILERYLNSAYFGHRAYGIFAAAQVFFSKTPEGPDPGRGGHCWPAWSRRPSAYDPAGSRPARRPPTGATT